MRTNEDYVPHEGLTALLHHVVNKFLSSTEDPRVSVLFSVSIPDKVRNIYNLQQLYYQ